MNYKEKRPLSIYKDLGNNLRKKFTDNYPAPLLESEYADFCSNLGKFISDNKEESGIKMALIHFPDPGDDPDLNKLLDIYGQDPLSAFELVQASKLARLEERINKLEALCITTQQKINTEPVRNENVIPMQSMAELIYDKLFVHQVSQKKYQSLSEDEVNWIHENVELSSVDANIFELCVTSESLSKAAEKAGINISKMKRRSAWIMEQIRQATMPKER